MTEPLPQRGTDGPLSWDNLRVPLAIMAALGSATGAVLLSATVESDLLGRVLMACGLVGFLVPLWVVSVPASRRDSRSILLVVCAVISLIALAALFGSWDITGLAVVLPCVAVMAWHVRGRRPQG